MDETDIANIVLEVGSAGFEWTGCGDTDGHTKRTGVLGSEDRGPAATVVDFESDEDIRREAIDDNSSFLHSV